MTEALIKVFAEAGIQWMGWALAVALVGMNVWMNARREKAFTGLVERNTAALTHLTTLIDERLPRGGRK
jgi:hypothetical protein